MSAFRADNALSSAAYEVVVSLSDFPVGTAIGGSR